MDTTDNHGFTTPQEGERNYEDRFASFFREIDAAVEIKDTDANRTNYEPKSDAKFYATDTGDIYIGDGSSWVKVPTSGKNPTLDSLTVNGAASIEDAQAGTLNSYSVRGGDNASLGMELAQGPPQLFAELLQDDVLSGYDADLYHKSHFSDNKYRFTITESSNSDTDLYRVDDLDAWLSTGNSTHITQEATAIFGSGSDNIRVNDHIVLPDGRFAIYTTTNDGDETDVRVGESIDNTTLQGQVMAHADNGAIRDGAGTVHHYVEDSNDMASTIDANSLRRITTPVDDLTNQTDQGTVIDMKGTYGWSGGDADLCRIGGDVYMFLDRKSNGEYTVALFRSRDFANWELQNDQLTGPSAGDFTVSRFGGRLWAMGEQTDGTQDDLSLWRLTPHHDAAEYRARSRAVNWEYNVMTADGLATGLTNSGSVSLNAGNGQLKLETGATSGSKANVVKWLNQGYSPRSNPYMSWQVDRTLVADVTFSDTQPELYVVSGAADTGALSLQHVGIGMDSGDLVGSVGDGGSQTTTTLISGANTGSKRLRVEYKANQRAEFWVDGRKRGEITNGLPSGTSDAGRALMAFVANSSSTNRVLNIHRTRFCQHADTRAR